MWNYVTLFTGSIALICWILFRFSTKSINFDLVGQQLLSRQWLEGNFEGSVIGPTNYILKMLFIYMPAELLGVDPKLFLIFSTIVVNIVTFIGMYLVVKRILKYFSIETGNIFNVSMLWLGAVAGSVFWVQFTNSRNLELLAGLTLIYLGLLLYRSPSLPQGVMFVVLASLTYFSDPLQLFTTSVILISYVLFNSFILQKEKWKKSLFILLPIGGSYLLSRLLVFVAQEVTGVNFISISTLSQSLVVVNNIPTVTIETGKNMLRLVVGTNEMGIWRQVLNMVLVGCLTALSLYSLIKNKTYTKHRSLVLFTILMLVTPIAIYMASGQAIFKDDTSRYLIVLAPALIILFSIGDIKSMSARTRRGAIIVIMPLLLISIGSLFYTALNIKDESILTTTHLESRYAYLEERDYRYGYASMDTAIPSMYLLGKNSERVLLPLSCEGNALRKSTLFYDKNIFTQNEKQDRVVPIILDGNSISNYPNNCSAELIQAQIGKPLATDSSDGNAILIFSSNQLKHLHF